jgi:sugar lactone lactonase YvrE
MPGSVLVTGRRGGRVDLLVCDNLRDQVSEHHVFPGWPFRFSRNRIALKTALYTPDGITMSADRRWLAVSNHDTHQVFVYDRTRKRKLRPTMRPHGVCEGVAFPHGLRFSPDGRSLYVADAGRPMIHRFDAPDGDWRESRISAASATIADEATFLKCRDNDREGGPKGLEVDRTGRVLMLTSQAQPFVAFDIENLFSD